MKKFLITALSLVSLFSMVHANEIIQGTLPEGGTLIADVGEEVVKRMFPGIPLLPAGFDISTAHTVLRQTAVEDVCGGFWLVTRIIGVWDADGALKELAEPIRETCVEIKSKYTLSFGGSRSFFKDLQSVASRVATFAKGYGLQAVASFNEVDDRVKILAGVALAATVGYVVYRQCKKDSKKST